MNLATIDDLITREGDYSNNPNDPGGETRFGITVKVARENGYHGDMKDLPRSFAQGVYLKRYYTDLRLDKVNAIWPEMADKLFDIGVNQGPVVGIRYLQIALNSLGYLIGKPDGIIGPATLSGLQSFLGHRNSAGKKVLMFMVAAQQSVDYMNNPKPEYEYGWQLNRSLFGVI